MTADVEDEYVVAQANEPLTPEGTFANERVACRYRDVVMEADRSRVDFMDVSPKMVLSVATAMIPFLENDDANRALMGANMQRQAVPLLKTEGPIVGTGMEYKAAVDSGVTVLARHSGTVKKASADEIIVEQEDGSADTYELIKFLRSNAGTCINQRPIVDVGDWVDKGQVIADGPATANGEIALGKNMLIGFTTWEGYNYEDAVLINERLVKEDIYTSIHIEEYETEARDTKLGPEEITRDIPNVGEEVLKELDERGIIRVGAEVRAGDILVGKVTPEGGDRAQRRGAAAARHLRREGQRGPDTSLRVPHGEYGIVVDVKVFTRENSDELSPGVNMVVRVYIAQKRKLQVGDKMAGRHGNKGVVSRILPQEDMPYLPDGRPLDICLNPLGVPSRMNIGQVLEVHLGRAAAALGWKVMTPVFDGANEQDIRDALTEAGLDPDGKTVLYDGRTGEPFDNRVTVAICTTSSSITWSTIRSTPVHRPLLAGHPAAAGRQGAVRRPALRRDGGLGAGGLRRRLHPPGDPHRQVGRCGRPRQDLRGHRQGQERAQARHPESFKVLIKELQSLALDVRVLDNEGNEIDLKQSFDDDDDIGLTLADEAGLTDKGVEVAGELEDGFDVSTPDLEDTEPDDAELFADFSVDLDDLSDDNF